MIFQRNLSRLSCILTILLVSIVRRLDNAIHWINLFLVDNTTRFVITYPLDSDLSVGQRYPPFIQLIIYILGYPSPVGARNDTRNQQNVPLYYISNFELEICCATIISFSRSILASCLRNISHSFICASYRSHKACTKKEISNKRLPQEKSLVRFKIRCIYCQAQKTEKKLKFGSFRAAMLLLCFPSVFLPCFAV